MKDIKFYDFSGILHDDDLFENEIWFDFCHINHEGNKYVAKVINQKNLHFRINFKIVISLLGH